MEGDTMRVKLILPALAEAGTPSYRPIKYSLFPPLGLATLAGYLAPDDEAEIVDEHISGRRTYSDSPDLVGIEVYVTSARRAYAIADAYRARGVHVVLGGLHPTSLPEEAQEHADTIITGPAEEAWPRFLADFRAGCSGRRYVSRVRSLDCLPVVRRDLWNRNDYLVPNSIVISRGCPHNCSFCYTSDFYRDGRKFYHMRLERALTEIESLPGRHLFFLDDNIFGDPDFSSALFREMRGTGRIWQGAATVAGIRNETLLKLAAESGAKSLFIGFESLNQKAVTACNKRHNKVVEYEDAIRRMHVHGIMVNASFVFGMDGDTLDTFRATVDWALENGIETATFHLLTPYPGTPLFDAMRKAGRIRHCNYDLYDTRHAVIKHDTLSPEELEAGYRRSYRDFYKWSSIFRSAGRYGCLTDRMRHFCYTAAWKKFDPVWAGIIKLKRLPFATVILERVLNAHR